MTAEQIAKLLELEAKATKGPIRVDGWDLWHVGESYESESDPHSFTGITAHKGCQTPLALANLELFAFLRNNAIPLCNALEAAQKREEELTKRLEAAMVAINQRPHEPGCATRRLYFSQERREENDKLGCTCWKSKALETLN